MSSEQVIEATLRVRYAETDAMGIVYHSNYIIWFEVGRGEYMRQQGGDYAHFEAQGYYLPVIEVRARYLAPPATETWSRSEPGSRKRGAAR